MFERHGADKIAEPTDAKWNDDVLAPLGLENLLDFVNVSIAKDPRRVRAETPRREVGIDVGGGSDDFWNDNGGLFDYFF